MFKYNQEVSLFTQQTAWERVYYITVFNSILFSKKQWFQLLFKVQIFP